MLAAAPAHAAELSPSAQTEIDALLNRLGTSKCQFYRNASWHSGSEDRDLLPPASSSTSATYQRLSPSSVIRFGGSSGACLVSARTSAGRSSGSSRLERASATARSMACSSSRTLPGHA